MLVVLVLVLLLLWSLNGFNVRQMSMSCNKLPCCRGRLNNACLVLLSYAGEFVPFSYLAHMHCCWAPYQFHTYIRTWIYFYI